MPYAVHLQTIIHFLVTSIHAIEFEPQLWIFYRVVSNVKEFRNLCRTGMDIVSPWIFSIEGSGSAQQKSYHEPLRCLFSFWCKKKFWNPALKWFTVWLNWPVTSWWSGWKRTPKKILLQKQEKPAPHPYVNFSTICKSLWLACCCWCWCRCGWHGWLVAADVTCSLSLIDDTSD